MKVPFSDAVPNLIAIAGPNGAGKSTFYRSFLRHESLEFINADEISVALGIGAYKAAEIAEAGRQFLYQRRERFIFETVFSDPAASKLGFLEEAVASGYNVVLCFVGISGSAVSVDRVGQRVVEGGHDVPRDKLEGRYPRVMENLRLAMLRLPLVLVYNNDDLRDPYRFCLAAGLGNVIEMVEPVPSWLRPLLPKG